MLWSATSIAKTICSLARVETMLEDEGLTNDASVLVLLRTATPSNVEVLHVRPPRPVAEHEPLGAALARDDAWPSISGADGKRELARRSDPDGAFRARARLDVRSSAAVGWSGVRGVATVAVVQTLPVNMPYRSALILIGFTAVVATRDSFAQ